jgi:hypothetical protein
VSNVVVGAQVCYLVRRGIVVGGQALAGHGIVVCCCSGRGRERGCVSAGTRWMKRRRGLMPETRVHVLSLYVVGKTKKKCEGEVTPL